MLLNETCKTSRLKSAAKTLMNLSSSLIKIKYHREIFSHESFRKSFRKSYQKLLATSKYMQKVQVVSTREASPVGHFGEIFRIQLSNHPLAFLKMRAFSSCFFTFQGFWTDWSTLSQISIGLLLR